MLELQISECRKALLSEHARKCFAFSTRAQKSSIFDTLKNILLNIIEQTDKFLNIISYLSGDMKKVGVVLIAVLLLVSFSLPTFVIAQDVCPIPCSTTADCNLDQSCSNGCCQANNCVAACSSNADCTIDHTCDAQQACCVPIPCTSSADCPFMCPSLANVFSLMQCNTCYNGFCLDPPPDECDCNKGSACAGAGPCTNVNKPVCEDPGLSSSKCVGCVTSGDCQNCAIPCVTDANCVSAGGLGGALDQCCFGFCSQGQGVNPCGTNCVTGGGQQQCTVGSTICGCTTNADCDDTDACTTDTCSGGSCSNTPIVCNDQNVCTDDSCNPQSGCVFTNNAGPCDDGFFCTNGFGEFCSQGVCTGNPRDCSDSKTCTDDSCNEGTDACDNIPNDFNCNDNICCTIDACNPQSGDPQTGCTFTTIDADNDGFGAFC